MKKFLASNGVDWIIVDNADYDKCMKHSWHVRKARNVKYAQAWIKEISSDTPVQLHRFIMGVSKFDDRHVDHLNGDGLDDRRENLQLTNHSLNQYNRSAHNKHGLPKGVVKKRCKNDGILYSSYIVNNYESIFLGVFATSEAAGLMYDDKLRELTIETGFEIEKYNSRCLNFPFISREEHDEIFRKDKIKRIELNGGYFGVKKRANSYTYIVRATDADGKRIYLGSFATAEEGALAYDYYYINHPEAMKRKVLNFYYTDEELEQVRNGEKVAPQVAHPKTSQYIGVSWNKNEGGWVVHTYYNGQQYHIGCFANEEHAAREYDTFIKSKGWDKKLNFD